MKFRGRSKFETRIAKNLEERGVNFTYETTSYNYQIRPYNAKCQECGSSNIYETRKYTPDFFLPNGIIVEAKGRFKPSDRKLMKAVMSSNPELDIRMLFQNPNVWLTKSKKKNYGTWCDYENIKWDKKLIPQKWLEEV